MAKSNEAVTKADKKAAKKTAKKPNPVVKYFKELKSEFKKVVWPSKKTVFNNTGVVLATVIVSGLFVWALDSVFTALLQLLVSQAG